MLNQKAMIEEFDALVAECKLLRKKAEYDDYSDLPDTDAVAMITSMASSIRRLAPPGSQHVESAETILKKIGCENPTVIPALLGILVALRNDVAAGRTQSVIELIHADLFSDFLEMAVHLLSEGFKDPAAVLGGSVLEGHLRQLAAKHSIPVDDAKGHPKKADLLNAELTAANAYSKGDQKNVTAWLHLRNSAAHGNYGDYSKEQVALLVQSVRDFVTRVPG